MKNKIMLWALAAVAFTLLPGCATESYKGYSEAVKAREQRLEKEAVARQLVDQTLMLQVAKISAGCNDPACQMGVLLVLSNIKNQAVQTAQNVAPMIAAPVNEALEWSKLAAQTVLGGMGIRANLAKAGFDAMRGPSDKDVVMEGFKLGNLYNDNAAND